MLLHSGVRNHPRSVCIDLPQKRAVLRGQVSNSLIIRQVGRAAIKWLANLNEGIIYFTDDSVNGKDDGIAH